MIAVLIFRLYHKNIEVRIDDDIFTAADFTISIVIFSYQINYILIYFNSYEKYSKNRKLRIYKTIFYFKRFNQKSLKSLHGISYRYIFSKKEII